jgi:hypothetical protein
MLRKKDISLFLFFLFDVLSLAHYPRTKKEILKFHFTAVKKIAFNFDRNVVNQKVSRQFYLFLSRLSWKWKACSYQECFNATFLPRSFPFIFFFCCCTSINQANVERYKKNAIVHARKIIRTSLWYENVLKRNLRNFILTPEIWTN